MIFVCDIKIKYHLQKLDVQINIALYLSPYHPYIFQNADIPEGTATTI